MKNSKTKKNKKLNLILPNLFSKFFGFEKNIDITNDITVLRRRNVVIKNILFLLNLVYFVLLLIITLTKMGGSDTLNWIITVSTFPLMFVLNYFLSKLIKKDEKDSIDHSITKQQIARYFIVSYLFITVVLFYLKINISPFNFVNGKTTTIIFTNLETFSYILFYITMIIIALFQDKKVLFNSGILMFSILTIIHFLVTHKTYDSSADINKILVDIILRSIVYIIFFIALYASVAISQSVLQQRKTELIKRHNIQENFLNISKDLFKVVLFRDNVLLKPEELSNLNNMAKSLARKFAISETEIKNMERYILITTRINEINDLTTLDDIDTDMKMQDVIEKSKLGAEIAKRIQLAQKSEDIARAFEQQTINSSFVSETNKIQREVLSDIILICDTYIKMRQALPYKRPQSHDNVIKNFKSVLYVFFRDDMLQRFYDFNKEFQQIYDSFIYN